jgi:SAM-dependent methyltransferase
VPSKWAKLRRDPVGSARRSWDKLIVGPWRYARRGDYNASRYWGDRFTRHGRSLRGVGDEGLPSEENEREYARSGEILRVLASDQGIDFHEGRTLEIGCGAGFYTRLMTNLGADDLTAYDITDVLFPELREEFPKVEFRTGDISNARIDGKFDRAVMIDVLQHIVNPERFRAALRNISDALADDASFVVGPLLESTPRRRHLYYVRFWALAELAAALPAWKIVADVEFRNGRLVVLRRAEAHVAH